MQAEDYGLGKTPHALILQELLHGLIDQCQKDKYLVI